MVYGDIGTSPLYAIRECFNPVHGIESNLANTLRHPVAGVLGAHPGRRGQVPDVRDASRQPRRRRHPRAAGAGDAEEQRRPGATRAARPDPAGAGRRGPALGRRDDHARHHGARGDRGPRGRHAGLPAVRGPDRARHPRRTLRRPEARHGADRRDVRPGHAGVVRGDRRARGPLDHARAASARGRQPVVGGAVHEPLPLARVPDPGRRRPVHHRGRGALRGHGPLRDPADPHRLVRRGLPGPPAQLLRAGGAAAAGGTGGGRQPVLPARTAGVGLSAGPARHGRGDHRVPGVDLGRLLARPAGRPARLFAPPDHRAHLRQGAGADLRAGGQRRADGRVLRPRPRVPALHQPGGRVRHRGGGHDGHDLAAPLRRRPRALGLGPVARRLGDRPLPARRSDVPLGQHHEDPARGLVPAGCRRSSSSP